MKRKILLKQARMKKSTSSGNNSNTTSSSNPSSKTNVKTLPDIILIKYEHNRVSANYSARTESLPANYNPRSLRSNSLICTRVPPTPDQHSTCECVLCPLTKYHLLKIPDYGRAPPVPQFSSPTYEIKKASAGLGMLAKRSFEIGDLILVERPIMVAPVNIDHFLGSAGFSEVLKSQNWNMAVKDVVEATLEMGFNRLCMRDQNEFLMLARSNVEGWGTLSNIWRMNMLDLPAIRSLGGKDDEVFVYTAVCKTLARVNHSCRPNCILIFDIASFSYQLRATKPIGAGEEIARSYIDPLRHATIAERQEALKSYGFTCSCLTCSSPSSSTESNIPVRIREKYDALKVEFVRDLVNNVISLLNPSQWTPQSSREIYKTCRELMKEMEMENLHGIEAYRNVLDIRVSAGLALDKSGGGGGKGDGAKADCVDDKRFVKEAKKLKAVSNRIATFILLSCRS
ncbi:hypothetical protein BDQ17DRAFT_1330366 [Cyathus striatus]|nr:hypothetical protein BDQ17DRAFT_1330366 [Cyathus striatus]